MSKKFILFILVIVSLNFGYSKVYAAHESWNHIVDDMAKIFDTAYDTYTSGDTNKAKSEVDVAYYRYYEKLGFEKTVMSYISGNRASVVEYQFSSVKKSMTNNSKNSHVYKELKVLISYLREDANKLDGVERSPFISFMSSLMIILREGVEAIIIVAAIIAYLLKLNRKDKLGVIYLGIFLAGIASILMAILLSRITGMSGANQEIIEGVTMLIAVAVLFQVSNWMISHSQEVAISRYIEGKINYSLENEKILPLATAAFLAVFREGAETIIFYRALLSDENQFQNMIWLGLFAGGIGLIVIYMAIRYLSFKVPLKPFFNGTSLLLFIMSITFLGNGIKELQEGNIIDITPIKGIKSFSILGIYPTFETMIPQVILLLISIVLWIYHLNNKNNKI
jgi:high-affinity iron transporter